MISSPGIDLPYYFNHFVIFITGNSPSFYKMLQSLIGFLIGLSIPLSVALFLGIIIVVEGIKNIRDKEEEIYTAKVEPAFTEEKTDPELNRRWSKIMDHVNSPNENDWRQAIIEADIMLEDLLVKLGYQGEGIGERLRRVSRGDFKTIDQAGEAHGFRNRIAHDGSDFALNQIEARRVINLYRSVFEEFYHISE